MPVQKNIYIINILYLNIKERYIKINSKFHDNKNNNVQRRNYIQ